MVVRWCVRASNVKLFGKLPSYYMSYAFAIWNVICFVNVYRVSSIVLCVGVRC